MGLPLLQVFVILALLTAAYFSNDNDPFSPA